MAAGQQGDGGDRATLGVSASKGQHARRRERAKQLGNRPEVLCRKDFRGRKEGGLPPGVNYREHGAHRDDSLTRPDLALEQPLHRVRSSQLVQEHTPRFLLPRGQSKRQPSVKRGKQSIADGHPRNRRRLGRDPSALRQNRLQDKGFVVAHPAPTRLDADAHLRAMHELQRSPPVQQPPLAAHVLRQWLANPIDAVEHHSHRGAEVERGHRAGRGVDGDLVTLQVLHGLVSAVLVEHLVLRVRKLQAPGIPADGAREDAERTQRESILVGVGPEERQVVDSPTTRSPKSVSSWGVR